jgi:ribosomal protein L16 Arg81 hydroxylase
MTAPGGFRPAPSLSRCVAVDPKTFADKHWGREPLLSRPGGDFTDLLSLDDVDELLSTRGMRSPFLRIAKDGVVQPAAAFTGGGGAGAEVADQVLDEKVLQLYADGATLVLQGLHRLWPPLIAFTGGLAAELGQPVQANAYLTPAGNRGFATHYDTHDVFVLQVAGRKRWTVHEPVLADPLERQAWGGRADEVAATAAGTPVLDEVLSPGDALYLPRGYLHAADALGEVSLHLTLGVRAFTRYSIVDALLATAAEEASLRTTLPLGLDLADPDALGPELAETVAALKAWLDRADPGEVAERLRRRWWPSHRPAPIRPVAQAAALDAVTADTRVAVRPGLRHQVVPAGERTLLRVFDRTLTLPASCTDALRAALAGPAVRVGELPGLDPPGQLTLARRLLREAILVPVS